VLSSILGGITAVFLAKVLLFSPKKSMLFYAETYRKFLTIALKKAL
jgi:hypothetical protein